MRKVLVKIIEQLHGLMLVAPFPVLAAIILKNFGYAHEVRLMLCGFLLLIPYFGTLIAAKKCKGLGLYLVFSLASTACVTLAAPDFETKVSLTIFAVMILLTRISARVRKKKGLLMTPAPITAVFFAAFYIIGLMAKDLLLQNLSYYLCFSYLILLLVYRNLTGLDNYFRLNQDTADIPYKKIARTNSALILVFIMVTAAAMILLPLTGLSNSAASLASGGLRLFIRMVAAIASGCAGKPYVAETAAETTASFHDLTVYDVTPTPEWVLYLDRIASNVLFVLACLVFIFLIFLLVRALFRRFCRIRKEGQDTIEFAGTDDDTQARTRREKSESSPLLFDLSPAGRIRRKYRRAVRRTGKKITSVSMTPSEIEAFTGLDKSEKNTGLHNLYEEARYSNHYDKRG